MVQIATFNLEKELLEKGYGPIVGMDEAGRGPLAGPVVAGAVFLKEVNNLDQKNIKNIEKELELIRDSKLLSEKRREEARDLISQYFYVGIGICDNETIDRMNILQASFLAMKKAFYALQKQVRDINKQNSLLIVLDGKASIPNFSFNQRAVVQGDKIVKSISAASIIAKTTRDKMMLEFHEKYPHYDFDKHKGYGTKLHREKIKQHGPCEIHRQSFRLV